MTALVQARPSAIDAGTDPALSLLRSFPGVHHRHSNGTLIAHLEGVHALLRQWGCSERICMAGLYHSVYGTEFYRRQTIPIASRPKVAAVIGVDAEELAYRFCTLDTRAFVQGIETTLKDGAGPSAALLEQDRSDLLHIFVANWVEQLPRMPAIRRTNHQKFMALVAPFLVRGAAEQIERIYGFDTPPRPNLQIVKAGQAEDPAAVLQVLDDFVPLHLQQRLSALMECNIWRYGWKASHTQTSHFFWHSHFAGDNGDGGEVDCEFELLDRPLVAPVLELWHLIRDHLARGHTAVRVYANGHTFGCDGHVHTDSTRPHHYTAIYYAHPAWEPNWGGETVFLDNGRKDVVNSVFPRPGRLVFFDGRVPHAARSPTRDCPALRSAIVIKTFDGSSRA